ncbi:MAG: hypothetical protein ACE363_05950 [Alphaproteobacteria bacterium]
MKTVIGRLREPSSWAGLAGAAILLGATDAEVQMWANAAAGLCAFLALILPETKGQ